MRPAEIGRRRILADLHDAAADGAGAGEMREQRLAVAAADGAGELRQIFVEGAEHFQHRVLVGEEHVPPHGRIGRGDAGKIAKAAGGEFEHLGARHFGELVGGADDGIGDEMRQVAGDRQYQVVVCGWHGLDGGAERAPERGQFFHSAGIGAVGRREDAPAVDEQGREAGIRAGILGAGDRMRRDEMHALGQMRRHVAQYGALDRADIGNGCAACQMRADLGGDRTADSDRNADDDQIGAGDRGGIALDHLVGKSELGDAPSRFRRTCRRHDLTHGALRPRRPRDRGADQASADQGEAIEQRCDRTRGLLLSPLPQSGCLFTQFLAFD